MSIIERQIALIAIVFTFFLNGAFAGDSEVVDGEIYLQTDGLFRVSVEMEHSGEPPFDYLLGWEIQTLSGDTLAVSNHPIGEPEDDATMDELVGVEIPQTIRQVKIFSRCRRHGLSDEPLVVEVPRNP